MSEFNNNAKLNNTYDVKSSAFDSSFNSFDSIRIGLASSDKIRQWSRGEVKKPETINYRTLKPEREGLFCERIFGPQKDWECHCGKYKRIRYKGVICDRCGVEVTKAKVRRERMGHIELAAPVSHIWYFRGIPSKMGILLDISPRALEKVLYFASYIVLDPGETPLSYKQILTEPEYDKYFKEYGTAFKAGMGAESVKQLLQEIDLAALSKELREKVDDSSGQKRLKAVRRLEVVEAFLQSGNQPEWMILEAVPVIPPDLRPMVQLDGGRFATSDLNDLYRRVINRNNRLKRLLELGAPEIICRNEKRMLQEAVDALIDNGRRGRPVTGPGNRPLKSLSDMLKGKQGRFRQNLLGKRVDYSGRSVIVVGPELKFYQCGLPKKMALELFKPFVMKRLVQDEYAHNIKSAKRMVEKMRPEVWDIVEDVIKEHPVLLNRAPTLHRLGIQAFEPILVEGKAIRLHPLVCTAYNADFDGDQMAVHVPLSVEAQAEARFLMLSVNNILAPKDGTPITTPTQDMVLGVYYLTMDGHADTFDKKGNLVSYGESGSGKVFKDYDEMLMAYRNGHVSLHAKVKVRQQLASGETALVASTVGRFIFNEHIPQDLGFVDRSVDPFGLEVNFECTKKELEKIIAKCFHKKGNTATAEMLDHIKSLGFRFSTQGAVTISVSDMVIPEIKHELIEKAHNEVDGYHKFYRRGGLTDEQLHNRVIETWTKTTKAVTDELLKNLDKRNNINIMAYSGARGSAKQIGQLAGMRGIMANTKGESVEIPIESNFREGLSVLEYFISTTGARKGLADTALRTADSGYLTRRLVDVSQDIIVRELDCETDQAIYLKPFTDGHSAVEPTIDNLVSQVLAENVLAEKSGEIIAYKNQFISREIAEKIVKATTKSVYIQREVIESLEERLTGRYLAEDVASDISGEIIAYKNQLVNADLAAKIVAETSRKIAVRSVLTCETKYGVCSRCYGLNLANGRSVNVGEAVGIIAAQSIGEPGTQLTMRTFHTGGVAGGDITQGLPRVEELFEARKPKPRELALIANLSGVVSLKETKKKSEIVITSDDGETSAQQIVFGAQLRVKPGDRVEAGTALTYGSVNPHDILKIVGVGGVHDYVTQEVQRVYRLQGIDVNDKHIEIIIKQMLDKIQIDDAGDTNLIPGSRVSMQVFSDANREAAENGQKPAEGSRILLGITKASLATESFLSAASFQETTRVLTEAAIKGKEDRLIGLKENVIIGKLIPAGTGMKRYHDIAIDSAPYDDVELEIM